MKKIIEVDSKMVGLEALLGEPVVLFCLNYIYAGKLMGVNKTQVLLEDGGIVYETGAFGDSKWKDFQKIGTVYVRKNMIEAYARGK